MWKAVLCALVVVLLAGGPGEAAEIHEAVKAGDPARVEAALAADPTRVDLRDEAGRTPLHWAARSGALGILTLLAERGADLDAVDAAGVAALHTAAATGNLGALRLVLDRGADAKVTTPTRSTALHLAARNGHSALLGPLVAAGGGLENRDQYGRTPLVVAAREMAGAETVRALLDLGAAVDAVDARGDTALTLAAWRGSADVVDLLLDRGASIPATQRRVTFERAVSKGLERLSFRFLEQGEKAGASDLARAAEGGSVAIVEALLRRGVPLDEPDANGWTALHFAADMGRLGVLGLLLDRGASVEKRTLMGQSAYNLAEDNRDPETLAFLSGRGASPAPPSFPAIEGEYLGQPRPGREPEPFAPGTVDGRYKLHGNVVFSPDGRQALWSVTIPPRGVGYGSGRTLVSERGVDGHWSYPRRAIFAGVEVEDVPCFHPDGSTLYDMARRPMPGVAEGGDENIWRWTRAGTGWGRPEPVRGAVNDVPQHWQFGVDRQGDLVFAATLADSAGGSDIYLSRPLDGSYQPPENLGAAVNTPEGEDAPHLSPDGRTLLFSRGMDIFVSFRTPAGSWTEAREVAAVNTPGMETLPVLSPEGALLFFTRDWRPYWVDAAVLREPPP